MTADCDSCDKKDLELTEEGRFPEHQGRTARGICGASHLLPLSR